MTITEIISYHLPDYQDMVWAPGHFQTRPRCLFNYRSLFRFITCVNSIGYPLCIYVLVQYKSYLKTQSCEKWSWYCKNSLNCKVNLSGFL
jgi:hypothetical protein